MTKAIIVNNCNNESLLRFTQTKLFYSTNGETRRFFKDCITTSTFEQAEELATINDVILETGDYLTSNFFHNPVRYAKDSKDVIKFDKDIPINYKKHYKIGTDQFYIVNNLLTTCVNSRKLIYLDNNETESATVPLGKHLYGLASGYKTVKYSLRHEFETVTVYDFCDRQLEYAKWLHSHKQLPDSVDVKEPVAGTYRVPNIDWEKWHNTNVNFIKLNLLECPVFPSDSFIWVSNAFMYEPTLFEYGYDYVKDAKNKLQEINKDCIITTN